MFSGIKKFFIAREVSSSISEVKMGKLGSAALSVWNFLDGKKTIIMALLTASELVLKAHGYSGPITLIDGVIKGLGWDHVAPAVDPEQVVVIGGMAVALGHKLIKSYQASK